MFSIIICTYNRAEYIYKTLQCIAKNDFPVGEYEVLLINNNSTDNTEQECSRFSKDYPSVNYQYFVETKQGLSHARNRGIEESKYDMLIFLDDDSFVKNDYLFNLKRQLHNHDDAIAFGGKIVPVFESGVEPKWISKWSYSWVSALDKGNEVVLFKGKSYPVGANMGFSKSCVDRYGNFNVELGRSEKNLMGGEEKDFFNRLKKNNVKIYYFPNIEVGHVIPEKRTTREYIVRLAQGVGLSEKLRSKANGKKSLYLSYFRELVKWGATIVLWFYYAIQLKVIKGNALVLFRWNVTKRLFGKSNAIS